MLRGRKRASSTGRRLGVVQGTTSSTSGDRRRRRRARGGRGRGSRGARAPPRPGLRGREGGLRRPPGLARGLPPSGVVRPPRSRRQRQARTIRARTRSTASAPTCERWPTRSSSRELRVLGHSMGGMAVRRAILHDPRWAETVTAVVFMDTVGGRAPGHRSRPRPLRRRDRAHRGPGRAEAGAGRDRPARLAVVPPGARRAAGLPGVRAAEVGVVVAGDVGDARRGDHHPARPAAPRSRRSPSRRSSSWARRTRRSSRRRATSRRPCRTPSSW